MQDEILQRISCIYAAIDRIEENDLKKLKGKFAHTNKINFFEQDFRGDFSDEDLYNYAHIVIHNIANLQDHLKRWAKSNNRDKAKVDETFNDSLDLKIVKDLSNNDKHGYPPRNNGYSRKCPKLININRIMEMKTQPKKGSSVVMTFRADGTPKISGNGTAKAVITGEVVDNTNNPIGDLHDIAIKAVKTWEELLVDFGLKS
jgi:hypothetical protein